jgi:hypothetical protein
VCSSDLILALREHRSADLTELTTLGAAALAPGQTVGSVNEAWPDSRVVPGRAIPATALAGSTETVTAAIVKIATGVVTPAWFLTTEWQVPVDTPAENLHAAVAAVRKLAVANQ